MRKLLSVLLLSILAAKSFAQKTDVKYEERAAEIKKERERSLSSARAPSYYDYENNFLLYELFLTRGSPRSESLIEKQAMGQA